jgi:diguanylate cyclase (GGDEF)-like protein
MTDRLALRSIFWTALVLFAAVGGLLSVGAVAPLYGEPLSGASSLVPSSVGIMSTFLQAAPLLSFAAFAMAMTGLVLLNREMTRRGTAVLAATAQVRQLQEAMHANADGIFLLRAIRDEAGTIHDFEIRDVNPSGAMLLRREARHLSGRRLGRDLVSPISGDIVARYVEAINGRTAVDEEIRVNRRHFAGGWIHHQVVPTAEGVAVTIKDISTRKREEVRLRRASDTDVLTSLSNRRGFLTLADQQLRIARRQDKDAVLFYVDLDDFKPLNDTYGHAEGDRALAAVARVLRRAVRDCDIVARMGGDEFTIMALDADRSAARIMQKRIEERIALLNASGELAAPISLTIGHTRVRPADEASLAELLARADALLCARKKRRRLTAMSNPRAATQAPSRNVRNRAGMAGPSSLVAPDAAAIARVTALAAAARVPGAPAGAPYQPRRMA